MSPRPLPGLAAIVAACSGCGFELVPATGAGADAPINGDGGIELADGAEAIDAPLCAWGSWGVPSAIAELNTGTLDARPRLSPDERTMTFYSTRSGGAGDRDLYSATRASLVDAFSPAFNVAELNTGSSERDPAPSADGLTLVFSSTRAGEHDIFIATRSSTTAAFSAPQPIAALNTSVREYFTAMSADGRTIYFSSDRTTGSVGGYDVWFSTRANTSSSFTTVQNLASINTGSDEYQALVSPDGREIYFSSTRTGSVEIFVSTRADTSSPFGPATLVTELSFAGEEHPGWMSHDGRRFYYSHQGSGVSQLYVATRTCQ